MNRYLFLVGGRRLFSGGLFVEGRERFFFRGDSYEDRYRDFYRELGLFLLFRFKKKNILLKYK